MNTLKRILRWHNILTIVLFAQVLSSVSAQAQQQEPLTVYAKGHGSIVSTVEERNITAALVVLRPNGSALITLISDLQLKADAQWSASESSSEEIELKITGGELSGNWSGSGKLVLSDDRKSIKELMINGKSFDGRELKLTFVADATESVRSEHINLVSY
jgi:hypothetical protein